MELPTHFLLIYGYLLLFAWILVGQSNIPLPATPILLAAGALTAEHELSFPLALASAALAAMVADSSWFFFGRRYGHHVLRILCKLSMEPTVCVRRTQDSFGRRRGFTLMIAKFVPGLATLAPPVAGENGMRYIEFLFFDAIGAALQSAIVGDGRCLGPSREQPNRDRLAAINIAVKEQLAVRGCRRCCGYGIKLPFGAIDHGDETGEVEEAGSVEVETRARVEGERGDFGARPEIEVQVP